MWATEASDQLDNGSRPGTDGNSAAQAVAASAFVSGLGGQSSQITRVFWYSYRPGDHPTSWDSALTDPSFAPRYSYCILAFGTLTSTCTTDGAIAYDSLDSAG